MFIHQINQTNMKNEFSYYKSVIEHIKSHFIPKV